MEDFQTESKASYYQVVMDSLKNILSLAYDALVLVLKKYWKRKLFNIHFGRLKS